VHVVLVVPGGVDRGGRERVIPALLDVIEGLTAHNRVTVVALGQETVACRFQLLGATVINVPPERRGPTRLARQLFRAVRAVGANGRPDVVHGFWASVSGLVAVLAAKRYRVASLVHVAGGELVAMPDIGYGGALGRGGRLIADVTLRRATEVTVASHWLAEMVRHRGYRIDGIIPLGVDINRFTPAPEQAVPGRLLHVASLNRVKDQPTLLRAVARVQETHPEVTLDIVGVDTLHGSVQQLAADLGLGDAVRFHGFVASDELPPFLHAAQLHIVSSRHEAGPVALVEAAGCGVPTVGTRVGHVADFAALDPPGAFAVNVGDADAMATAICALLDDAALRSQFGSVARQWAEANDRHATVNAFEACYQRLRAAD
jgi:glycosyltransferase involved in cell wall biosynthesis